MQPLRSSFRSSFRFCAPLLASFLAVVAGCSAFPDVTYGEDTGAVTAAKDAAAVVTEPPAAPGADASFENEQPIEPEESDAESPDAGAPDAGPPDPGVPDAGVADAGPGPTCDKAPCVGSACGVPGTCDRCRDACKRSTKKCCADVDVTEPGGVALSCVAEGTRCAGETP